MTAGRGIVHSERAGADLDATSRLHGVQLWVALPTDQEEREPAFGHYPATDIPELDVAGASVRVIMGEAYGHVSPVMSYSPMVYLEYGIPKGTAITLPDVYPELAAYVVAGDVRIERHSVTKGVMAVARSGATVQLEADTDAHVLVIGGLPWGNGISGGISFPARRSASKRQRSTGRKGSSIRCLERKSTSRCLIDGYEPDADDR